MPVPTANPKQLTVTRHRLIIVAMGDLFKLIWWAAVGLFRPRSALQAEILVLRHQLNVLRRRSPKRVAVRAHLWGVSSSRHQCCSLVRPRKPNRGTEMKNSPYLDKPFDPLAVALRST